MFLKFVYALRSKNMIVNFPSHRFNGVLTSFLCSGITLKFACLTALHNYTYYACDAHAQNTRACVGLVVCSFNRKKRLSNRNSFTKRVKNEMINVTNENKMSKSKCQKLIIKCYW